jgi:hypothetical protein
MPVASMRGSVALFAFAATRAAACRCGSDSNFDYCGSDGWCYDSSFTDYASGSLCGGRFGSHCTANYWCPGELGHCTFDSGCHCLQTTGDHKRTLTDSNSGGYCYACRACPAHSTWSATGSGCPCDMGYSVSADRTACVRQSYSPPPPVRHQTPAPAPSSRRRSSSYYPPPSPTPPPWTPPPPPPPPTPRRGSVSGFTLIAVAIGILSALCKFGKCILSGFKKLYACACGPELAQDEIAPDLELPELRGPEASSCAQAAAAAGSVPEEQQVTTTPVELVHRTSNPIGGGTLQQPSSIHEFLVNNGLVQYEATLSELGVTQLSH